ncbi:MAG: hypothetical protein ACD_24C00035G0003 [uncultured bacterium]|nr:MAG: hypothetical protein ACD_24C00035G0003 [uncultured bacterium]
MIENVIFDFDGTIVDSFNEVIRLVNSLSEKYGFKKISQIQIAKMRNQGIEEAIKTLGVNIFKLPFLLLEVRSLYKDSIKNLKPFKGIGELLKKLKEKGLFLEIVTTNSEENTTEFLEKNDMNVFNFIKGDVSFFGKDTILIGEMKVHDLRPEETIYIGDEIRDVEAAKSAGVKVISVTWGYNSKKILESYSPDFIAQKPQQLLKFLEKEFDRQDLF